MRRNKDPAPIVALRSRPDAVVDDRPAGRPWRFVVALVLAFALGAALGVVVSSAVLGREIKRIEDTLQRGPTVRYPLEPKR